MRRSQEDAHPSQAARPPGLKKAADSISPAVKGLYQDHKPPKSGGSCKTVLGVGDISLGKMMAQRCATTCCSVGSLKVAGDLTVGHRWNRRQRRQRASQLSVQAQGTQNCHFLDGNDHGFITLQVAPPQRLKQLKPVNMEPNESLVLYPSIKE